MKSWEKTCKNLIEATLSGQPQELNEIDWKVDISDNNEKIAHHLSAFSNYSNGGFLVYGIADEGAVPGVTREQSIDILKKLGNIARSNLEPQIILDHVNMEIQGQSVLCVHVSESSHKPVHIKSGTIYDSYTRSASQTRKLSKEEVHKMIALSAGHTFESRLHPTVYQADEVIARLDYVTYFDLSKMKQPSSQDEILNILERDSLIKKIDTGYQMTNLGILLLAKNLDEYKDVKRKVARVIVYDGKNRIKTIKQNEGNLGYAAGFTRLIEYINTLLPSNEIIQQALRKEVRVYPEIAIRELVANALIHQDFDISGTGVTIEIFSDRIEITNPGKPFVEINRLMDLPPRSRNQMLASIMRRFRICEELGSGIEKVVFECEYYQLPAPLFETKGENTIVTLYSHRKLTQMDKADRIRACYLHACLKQVSGEVMTNESVRKRFDIPANNYPTASKIINETKSKGLIKVKDPTNISNRNVQYVPYWA